MTRRSRIGRLPTRILIANRGEVAVRIIEACKQLDIESVAVFADSDRNSLHVRRANHAIGIGGQSAADSYLRVEKIIGAARTSGSDAVHPGYGFLSESPDFAEATARAGLVFIGPPPEAMRMLGSKVLAKQLADRLGIPTVPGYWGANQTLDQVKAQATRIGFPLLIKAAAGGGGRGMRIVGEEAELPDAIEGAQREAISAFGDGTIFLERYLTAPRHIEVQILADAFGHVLCLGERDCSAQRRHQKVIEETPAGLLDMSTRQQLFDAASQLASAAGYVNAGTVEFLVEREAFYFLEVNARLQVEHPVTELATGIDIVVAQIRIAGGESLPLSQAEVIVRGHAIEARLYAEDPRRGFMPTSGKVVACALPHLPGVRIDTGIEAGDEVTPYFDPLLAKICALGETRSGAIRRLAVALAQVEIAGVTTNLSLLQAVLADPTFVENRYTTTFITDRSGELIHKDAPVGDELWLAAAVGLAYPETAAVSGDVGANTSASIDSAGPRQAPTLKLGTWRHSTSRRTVRVRCENETRSVVLMPIGVERWSLGANDTIVATRDRHSGNVIITTKTGARNVRIYRQGRSVHIVDGGVSRQFEVGPAPSVSQVVPAHTESTAAEVYSPMPGVVTKVFVDEGVLVSASQPLVAIEAMKMEHLIVAGIPGVVRHLPYAVGSMVAAGAAIATIELEGVGHEPR